MRISVFSKFDMAGGSEFRCVEIANGLSKYTDNEVFILSEKKFAKNLNSYVNKSINIIEDCFDSPDFFYSTDIIIIVNTDSRDFSTVDYWIGKSDRHNKVINMDKMKGKTFCFIYNFLISPCRHLVDFKKYGIDVKIITTNRKFFDEITKQDRYEDARFLPRYVLESPIDNNKVDIFFREPKETICFGMHSKRLDNKWNDEILKLINDVNKRYGFDVIKFRFMGVKESLKNKIGNIKNVIAMDEDTESIRDFLKQIDIFLFFPDWKREEPWARVIAEAMVSGCPIIALNKGGTSDQVLNYNNGILCKNYNDYYKAVIYLIEHRDIIPIMSNNSIRIAKNFYSEEIVKKLIFILNN